MILCCGEALIDMIPSVNEKGQPSFTPYAGGAVFNTAIALGRLRARTGFLSGISSDLFGSLLRDTLARSNVDSSMAIISDRPTTLAFVQLTNGHASYIFYDENTAGRLLDPANLPELPDGTLALYFGGISLIGEPGSEFYAALALRESPDRVIMLDPNIRAGFIKDERAYRARLDRIIAHADIVKVSDEDLNWIIPGMLSLDDKVSKICAMGPSLVILTKGGAGVAAAAQGRSMVSVMARRVEVVDTVGAGDTFNAGVLSKLSELRLLTKEALKQISDEHIRMALEQGVRVAAITVSRSGANPPWAEELAAADALSDQRSERSDSATTSATPQTKE
ncbi:carbohydrate kinase [Defluviimonas aestuarii]|uniref:carbohydrate kinase family protein n=1 Tax=Albidovulum aestuarii TaxID=1130726 RepID=UPI00249BE916|nr:carbohydrate kinase [Defluviimonas aestuarii]MDI3336867.1 carbohydrate kinase [Defluviimonas aestuarii]